MADRFIKVDQSVRSVVHDGNGNPPMENLATQEFEGQTYEIYPRAFDMSYNESNFFSYNATNDGNGYTTLIAYAKIVGVTSDINEVQAPIPDETVGFTNWEGISRSWKFPDYYWIPAKQPPQSVTVTLSGAPSIVEGDFDTQFVKYTVALNEVARTTYSVDYNTSDGTATAGFDYKATSGTITFLPGEISREIQMPIIGDTIPEANEFFSITINKSVYEQSNLITIDNSAKTINTFIVDKMLQQSNGSLELIEKLVENRSNLFELLKPIIFDLRNPVVVNQLEAADQVLGRFNLIVGNAAKFVPLRLELQEQLASASKIQQPLQREQAEWVAFRNYEVNMYDAAMEFVIATGITTYVTAYAASAAVTGGVELFIAAAAAATGVALPTASVVAAGALVVSNPAILALGLSAAGIIVYKQYFQDKVKEQLGREFDEKHPVPTELTVPNYEIKILLRDGLDGSFYYEKYADVAASKMDPVQHYDQYGWHEGRDPNAGFSTTGYLAANPDVAKAAVNPLNHYDTYGWKEGRDPSASFDNELYLARNPDVKSAGLDPLAHYLQYGQGEGRQAYAAVGAPGELAKHPGFDAEYYLLSNPDVAKAALAAGGDTFAYAYQHFETYGWHEGRNPNAVFDTKGYLATYKDVAAANIDPLAHYDSFGFKEGRDPSAHFDTKGYLAANGDVKAAGLDPMLHYLQYGALEGRAMLDDGHFG